MRSAIVTFLLGILSMPYGASAHIPALLLPLDGTPMMTYYIGQADISRAIYSELSKPGDFFVANFSVQRGSTKNLVQLFVPVCPNIPQYVNFQPSALIIKGEVPWKTLRESNDAFIQRLKSKAVAEIASNYTQKNRPKYHEEFTNQDFWVGGEWRGRLKPGLYSLVIFDAKRMTGTFTVGMNEKEAFNGDIFEYAGRVAQRISERICSPGGYTGEI